MTLVNIVAEYERMKLQRHNWRSATIILAAVIVVAMILALIGMFVGMRNPTRADLAVAVPRDCLLSVDAGAERVYIAIELTLLAQAYGYLSELTVPDRYAGEIEDAILLPALPPLAELTGGEIGSVLTAAADRSLFLSSEGDRSAGVLLVVVDVTNADAVRRIDGIELVWSGGEPVYEQSVPLGIDYGDGSCDVAVPVESHG
ncbi:hypothetical protein [Microbacterium sp. NPDC087868]|uniref:hypothetical protein n=1 Tax=Microbacterium sp. NPDC087868 TaxID=3364195 RepID=UPI00384E9DD9